MHIGRVQDLRLLQIERGLGGVLRRGRLDLGERGARVAIAVEHQRGGWPGRRCLWSIAILRGVRGGRGRGGGGGAEVEQRLETVGGGDDRGRVGLRLDTIVMVVDAVVVAHTVVVVVVVGGVERVFHAGRKHIRQITLRRGGDDLLRESVVSSAARSTVCSGCGGACSSVRAADSRVVIDAVLVRGQRQLVAAMVRVRVQLVPWLPRQVGSLRVAPVFGKRRKRNAKLELEC